MAEKIEKVVEKVEKAPKVAKVKQPKQPTKMSRMIDILQMKSIKHINDAVEKLATFYPSDDKKLLKNQIMCTIYQVKKQNKKSVIGYTWDEENYKVVKKA